MEYTDRQHLLIHIINFHAKYGYSYTQSDNWSSRLTFSMLKSRSSLLWMSTIGSLAFLISIILFKIIKSFRRRRTFNQPNGEEEDLDVIGVDDDVNVDIDDDDLEVDVDDDDFHTAVEYLPRPGTSVSLNSYGPYSYSGQLGLDMDHLLSKVQAEIVLYQGEVRNEANEYREERTLMNKYPTLLPDFEGMWERHDRFLKWMPPRPILTNAA